jgi:glycosyltransferase involved in cell wall biosynthesis
MITFVIVTASYNNEYWFMKNISSVIGQTYPHWSLHYIDDASEDSTGELIDIWTQAGPLQGKCRVVHNEKRKGSLENLYTTILGLDPHDVVVCLDGDDSFAHPKVLEKLASIYLDPSVWLTYGNLEPDPPVIECTFHPYPEEVCSQRTFREHPFLATHLKTFYAKLCQNIKKEDLMDSGIFFPVCGDAALMFPMLEMASKGHTRFVEEVLYTYNIANDLNDFKVNKHLVDDTSAKIRSLNRYEPIDALF